MNARAHVLAGCLALGAVAAAAQAPVLDRAELDQAIVAEMPGMAAFVVARGADVVYEYYGQGVGPDSEMSLLAGTAHVVAAAYGVGVARGELPREETPIDDALGKVRANDDRFHAIAIRDFLRMTTGLADYNFPWWEGDPLTLIYRTKILSDPGSRWTPEYQNLSTVDYLMSRLTGAKLHAYTDERLLKPLGISGARWWPDRMGNAVDVKLRDAIKVAQLYLAGGTWQGVSLFDERWAREATRLQVPMQPGSLLGIESIVGMGYFWWIVERGGIRGYVDIGYGGSTEDAPQLIILVVPESNLVVLMWNHGVEGRRESFDAWFDFIDRVIVQRTKG